MCVRTCTNDGVDGGEIKKPPISTLISDKLQQSRGFKLKDKYLRRYDEVINEEINKELLPMEKVINKSEKDRFNNNNNNNNNIDNKQQVSMDFLAIIMIKYRTIMNLLVKNFEIYEKSKLHKILFTTTQPGHIIAMIAVLSLLSALNPLTVNDISSSRQTKSALMSFIYLTSFVVHFGSQIWMTFVSGLSLYFALPRHVFNDVQRVLFPRYFTINACLSFTTLLIFVKYHPINTWNTEIVIQIGGMSIALFLELLIRIYFTPPLLRLMVEKKAIEYASGTGKEIGCENLTTLKNCPHYMRIHRAFRKTHSIIAMGNIITMACTLLHLYYIANKLCYSL